LQLIGLFVILISVLLVNLTKYSFKKPVPQPAPEPVKTVTEHGNKPGEAKKIQTIITWNILSTYK
jgi:hypothetical protein